MQTSFLGDLVLTTPLIGELALRGPVDVVATPAGATLLANNPAVRRVFAYDKRGRDSSLAALVRLAATLRSHLAAQRRSHATVAYLAQGSVRSAVLALLAGIGERVGFATSSGRVLYTRRVRFADDRHHAERLLQLAAADPESLGERPHLRPRLYPGERDIAEVSRFLDETGWDAQPFVAFAPGSHWATKRWPHFASLTRAVSARLPIVVVGSEAERDLAHALVEVAPGRVADATGRFTLLGSAALIGRAAALVANDSAAVHLASAMETPTVALFGPTVPQFGFGPLARRSAAAGVDGLACRPCDRHGPRVCPLGHWRCMRELTPDHVAHLLSALLPAGAP